MKTQTLSDADLLRRFAGGGEESAFRVLTDRYQGLVYHTALRSTGDAELAQDVCQAVFVLLARKAGKLHAEGGLAGWLHRAAVLETRSAARREQRRREVLRDMENAMHNTPPPNEPALHPALPLLDQALDRLPGPDREVLLAHYFHGWTYGEIARRQQETEAAVQRRASRAVEKLSVSLRRAGVAVPTLVLAAGLSAVLQSPAPAGVVVALPAAAVTPVPVAGVSLLAKAAALVLAGGLSGAVGYALTPPIAQASRHDGAGLAPADHQNQNTSNNPDIPLTGPRGTWQEVVARAAAALSSSRSELANARAVWHLKALDMGELKSALLWAKALPDAAKGTILGALILSLRAMEDPAAAWSEQVELFDREQGQLEPALVQSGKRIARQLWERDPTGAIARLSSLEKAMHLQEGAGQAAEEVAASREGREAIHLVIDQIPDDATRAGAVKGFLHLGDPTENLSWLIDMKFPDETVRQRLLATAIWRTDDGGIYDPVLTKWLATLPPETAAAHRDSLRAALLAQPEEWRLPVSRRITDPELRRAVQESL